MTVATIKESANEAAPNPCSVESTPINKIENGFSINDVFVIFASSSVALSTVSIVANTLVSSLIFSKPDCPENKVA